MTQSNTVSPSKCYYSSVRFVSVKVFLVIAILLGTSGSALTYQVIKNKNSSVAQNLDSQSSSVPQSVNSDFVHAPDNTKECVAKIIGGVTLDSLIQGSREATQAEIEALNYCYKPYPDTKKTASQSSQPAPSANPTSSKSLSPNSPKPKPSPSPNYDIHAEVWTKNGYDGASYEYKVNCGPNYAILETCFLWDLSRVVVTSPSGTIYDLNKDFNTNAYSGEITRRWVLYGPAGGGLPLSGKYVFTYYKGDSVSLTQELNYTPELVSPPTNITYTKEGNDITISWRAPSGINSKMWYKPSIDPPGNERQIISKVIEWDATSAKLEKVPVSAGEQVEVNVAIFFQGGYAYPKPIMITW